MKKTNYIPYYCYLCNNNDINKYCYLTDTSVLYTCVNSMLEEK